MATPEHLCRYYMYLIQKYQAPLPAHDRIKHPLAVCSTLESARNHTVCAHHHACIACEPALVTGREAAEVLVLDCGPQLELVRPLIDRHCISYQHLQPSQSNQAT